MMSDKQIRAKYGEPGTKHLVQLKLPYPMRIAWDKKSTITTMQCHRLVHDRLQAIFSEILATYGLTRIKQLGIDLFGGCYAFRKMRGGNSWSRHAWGLPVDLDPERNGLKTPWRKAQFSQPEYADLISIFERHGYFNLGKEKNYDAMHFEPLM